MFPTFYFIFRPLVRLCELASFWLLFKFLFGPAKLANTLAIRECCYYLVDIRAFSQISPKSGRPAEAVELNKTM